MKTRLAFILGILALTVGSEALAQTQPVQRSVESTITGTLVSSSGTSLVIRADNGAEQSFDVDASTTIPAGLTPGTRVTVNYHSLEGGRRHAVRVMQSAASSEPPPVTAPTTSLTAPTTPDTLPTTPVLPPPTVPELAPAPEPTMAAEPIAADRLPETASEMPMLALAGLMTLAAGLLLRELRRRAA